MIHLTTPQIQALCHEVIAEYNKKLGSFFFFGPNKSKINAKITFLMLIANLTDKTPTSAFIDVYRFYKDSSSPLREYLEPKIVTILGISLPIFTSKTRFTFLVERTKAIECFTKLADAIQVQYANDQILCQVETANQRASLNT